MVGLPSELAHRREVLGRLRNDLGLGLRAFPLSFGLWSTSTLARLLMLLERPGRFPAPERPVFLIGAPRTGTTFLQRLLVELGVGRGLALGRMVWPSAVLHRGLGPLLPRLDALGVARFHDPKAHETGLASVETEDAALLLRFLDGFLAYAFFTAWNAEAVPPDPTDATTVARDLDWLDRLWRTHSAETGTRVVAKAASFGVRVRALHARYPDARFIYTLRDPVQVVLSALSLVQGALTRRFPHLAQDASRRAIHTANVYAALVELLNRFAEDYAAVDFPREAVLLCPYSRLVGDLEPEVLQMMEFLAVEPSGSVRARLQQRSQAQRARKSEHRYSLSQYGLDAAQVRRDCAPFLDTFGSYLAPRESLAC